MATPVRSGAVLSAAVLALLPLLGTPAHAVDRQAKDIVTGVCSACHAVGKENAPRIGDRAAWIPRMSHGLDALVATAIRDMASAGTRTPCFTHRCRVCWMKPLALANAESEWPWSSSQRANFRPKDHAVWGFCRFATPQ